MGTYETTKVNDGNEIKKSKIAEKRKIILEN